MLPKKIKFTLGVCLIIAAVGYLIAVALQNTSEYYLTVDELKQREATLAGRDVRVAGRVVPGSAAWEPRTLTLAFSIFPIPAPNAKAVARVSGADPVVFPVICMGNPKPDMFAENRDVIVEGKLLGNGRIKAWQVLTQCPSKYEPEKKK
jgi:cytochrome c-type biogenesis protein CcmE